MSVVAVIPARGGSKGIPRKNLQPVGGIPLIGRSICAGLAAESVDRVYVSTEDAEIAEVAEGFGATVIPRPVELAADETYTLPVLKHAVEWITEADEAPEILVNLQCTSPFTTGWDIDKAVTIHKQHDETDVVMSICRDGSYQLHLDSPSGIEWLTVDPTVISMRRQEHLPVYRLNGSLWVFRPPALMAAEHSHFGSIRCYEMPAERSIDIDSAMDLHLAEAMCRYQDQWIVIGSSPGAPAGFAAARARYPRAKTITTNRGHELFTNGDRPDVYHIHDMNACEIFQPQARAFSVLGSRTTTIKKVESSLKRRGVDWFDEFLELTSHEHPGWFRPGAYASCGLSGLMCLQYAINNGADAIHLVGMEGYGDGGHYFNGDPDLGVEKNCRFTKSLIEPFTQSCIDACPDVEFTFYGNLNYEVRGENVRCVS